MSNVCFILIDITIFADISDEFKSVIEELQPHEDKVHCVLNKADMLDTESLMRVYGALLWSMGKVFGGAEVLFLIYKSNILDVVEVTLRL